MLALSRWTLAAPLAVLILISSSARATDWVLLFNDNDYLASNPELSVCRKLREIQNKAAHVKCVAFTHTGGWAVLYGKNGYYTHDVPKPCLQKLAEIAQAGGTSNWVAFTHDGGWCVLSGRNTLDAGNVPTAIVDKVREIGRTGCTFKSLSFTPGGGCALLFDERGSWSRGPGLPESAGAKIAELTKSGATLKSIAFAPGGGWTLFWGQHGNWSEGVPRQALDRILAVRKAGGTLKAIAYTQAAVQFDPQASYVLESRPARHVQATLSTEIALPNAKVEHWFIYAPQVPDLPCQHDVLCHFEPGGHAVRELSPLARPLTLLQINDGRKAVVTLLSIDATLYSRRLVPVGKDQPAARVTELTPDQVAQHTRGSALADYQAPAVQAWMLGNRLTRTGDESELAFAHRVFSCIKHHFTYEYPTDNHAASQVCQAGRADCGGLSALFAAVMRANHVPTRMLGGRWAVSQTAKSYQVHVKADFFAPGIGWVPVDASNAVTHDNGENLYFGNDPGDFLALMSDEDALLESFVSGQKHVRYMQGIHYWWQGSGSGKNGRFNEKWTVREQ